nr:MAG TPA: peptidase [Caudoviricetes sp.]
MINYGNMSVLTLTPYDNISLHEIVHAFDLFPVCKEG